MLAGRFLKFKIFEQKSVVFYNNEQDLLKNFFVGQIKRQKSFAKYIVKYKLLNKINKSKLK